MKGEEKRKMEEERNVALTLAWLWLGNSYLMLTLWQN